MKKIPMTIIVHTDRIKHSDYGQISLLGEPLNEPLMRCRFCDIQPKFEYYNMIENYRIEHNCRITGSQYIINGKSYSDICEQWNKYYGKIYGEDAK